MTPSFRLWRSSVTVEELTATVARYLGEERTRSSFESFAATQRISLEPRGGGRFPAAALRRASARLGDRRGLVAARAVAAAAQAHGLDQGRAQAARRRQCGDPVQPRNPADRARPRAPGHRGVRQGPAADLLEPAVRRNPRSAAGADARRHRRSTKSCATTPSTARSAPATVDDLVRERLARYVSDSEPFRERFAERGLVIEVRANRMPDGGIVTTVTDITPSVEAAEALERANETLERRVRERTNELTRLNAELGRAKAEAEEANISKTRFLAAASHDILQPLNAARLYVTSLVERQGGGEDARLVGNVDASLEAVEEILGALLDISRLDTGAMRPEIRQLPHRRAAAPARGRIRAAGAREGARARHSCPARSRCAPTGGCCGGCCRTSSPTPSNTRRKGRVLVGCRRRGGRLRIDVYDTGLGIPQSKKRVIFREFHRLDEGAKVARGLGPRPLDRRAHRARARSQDRAALGARPRLAFLGRGAAVERRCRRRRRRASRRASIAASSPASRCSASTTSRRSSTAWRRCSAAGAAGCSRRRTSRPRSPRSREAQAAPNGLLVDYHLDGGNGIEAIAELRRRFGADLPAILITADRSPHVRDEARAQRHPGAEQAAQAGGAARADGAMARAARGGGGVAPLRIAEHERSINARPPPAATGRARSWRRRSPPGCGSRRRASAGSPRHAPSRSPPRRRARRRSAC